MITPHKEFKSISLLKLKEIMGEKPILIDVRNFYEQKVAEKLGFIYGSL